MAEDGVDGVQPNRLRMSHNPYLQQHAHQAIAWWPWGEEAFALARKENKPVFLSIGYATCHWCHVMSHEVFDDPEVATILNQDYIAIKADREELPDVDSYYMLATQLFTGYGGWPNSLWLQADKKPWYCGGYFPKEGRHGQPGFETMLQQLASVWRTQKSLIAQQAKKMDEAIGLMQQQVRSEVQELKSIDTIVAEANQRYADQFDDVHGGFGHKPKFPSHQILENLATRSSAESDQQTLIMFRSTLDAMAKGGLRDHLGGGFHRYCTDEKWLVPHFEKMLYDNALLLKSFSLGFERLQSPLYQEVVEELIAWLCREMKAEQGGFYTALDADSAYYLWSYEDLKDSLSGSEADYGLNVFSVSKDGNYQNEITGKKTGKNILHLTKLICEPRLKQLKTILLQQREQRPKPSKDTKIITSWNSLLISGFSQAGRVFKRPTWIKEAEALAQWLLVNLSDEKRLFHSIIDHEPPSPGYLEDYAYLGNSLVDLFDVTQNHLWLDKAENISEKMISYFFNPEEGVFYSAESQENHLPQRLTQPYDEALPSGAGMALKLLIRLNRLRENKNRIKVQERTINWFQSLWINHPYGLDSAVQAFELLVYGKNRIIHDKNLQFKIELRNCFLTIINKNKNIYRIAMRTKLNYPNDQSQLEEAINNQLSFKVEFENKQQGLILDYYYSNRNKIKYLEKERHEDQKTQWLELSQKIKLHQAWSGSQKSLYLKLILQVCYNQRCWLVEESHIQPVLLAEGTNTL